jgi:hypothetical protein
LGNLTGKDSNNSENPITSNQPTLLLILLQTKIADYQTKKSIQILILKMK